MFLGDYCQRGSDQIFSGKLVEKGAGNQPVMSSRKISMMEAGRAAAGTPSIFLEMDG